MLISRGVSPIRIDVHKQKETVAAQFIKRAVAAKFMSPSTLSVSALQVFATLLSSL